MELNNSIDIDWSKEFSNPSKISTEQIENIVSDYLTNNSPSASGGSDTASVNDVKQYLGLQ